MSDAYLDQLIDDAFPPVDPAPRWDDVLVRARRSRVRSGLVVVFVAALVVVPGAFAIGSKIADLFEGTPAPAPVATTFDQFNAMADYAVQHGFRQTAPHADTSTAHGVLKVDAPDGPIDLWAAAQVGGGVCWFYDWESDLPNGGGSCSQSSPPAGNIGFGTETSATHPQTLVLSGYVYVPAARVQVALADGTTTDLPVVENLYLGAFDEGSKPVSISAYDDGGNVVAHVDLP